MQRRRAKMADKKGTNDLGDWFIIREAQEVDDSLEQLDSLEELFDTSGSDISDLIDDSIVDQGNSLALYNEQITEACNSAIAEFVNRKQTPSSKGECVAALSPRLASVKLTSTQEKGEKKSKRKLFQDSGLGEDETEDITQPQVASTSPVDNANNNTSVGLKYGALEVLRSSNRLATLHGKFKDNFQVSFTELTRTYKSDKTTCQSWVVAAMFVPEEVLEAAKILLQQQCNYLQLITHGYHGLFLLEFKHAKSRQTVRNLFVTMLNVNENQLLMSPPRIRSTPCAVYFWRQSLGNCSYQFGELPDWIAQQTMVSHQTGAAPEAFDLAEMVQWAYDNEMLDEPAIAYHYAVLAQDDRNASAWLKCNNHVKYVKDCAYMVKLLKKQEMRDMSMSAWISKCCLNVTGEGDWKPIGMFLKYQNVNIVAFLGALRFFLKCVPKKQCIVFHGPPDTGKSMFCYSLIKFLHGKVISFMNSKSHFWLQPLADCKVGLMDDATYQAWTYMDVYMRTALDGNQICLDAKHKTPVQMKLPPLFITTNIDVPKENTLMYLHSRVQTFAFMNKMPLNEDGTPVYTFTDLNWKCFFTRLAKQLDLTPTEEYGETERTLRLCPGSTAESI